MKKLISYSSLALSSLAFVLLASCVSDLSKNDPAREISSLSGQAPGESTAKNDAAPTYRGCEDGLAVSVVQRSAVVDLAVRQAEGELANSPDKVRDPDFRSRIATFAAATVEDKTPLINIDRSCWAEFYEGQKNLAAGNEAGAKENGEAWKTCLEALFPDRVAIARPYFSCFNPPAPKYPPPGM